MGRVSGTACGELVVQGVMANVVVDFNVSIFGRLVDSSAVLVNMIHRECRSCLAVAGV